jgi:mono/diheme cytochrome c family protein
MRTILAALLLAAPTLAAPTLAAAQSPQYREGEKVFAETCSICHGANGRGGPAYANPIWGQGAQLAKFGTAQALFEYHQMLMPFDNPARISDPLKWAVTLYVLANHGAVPAETTLGPQNAGTVHIR